MQENMVHEDVAVEERYNKRERRRRERKIFGYENQIKWGGERKMGRGGFFHHFAEVDIKH